MLKYTVLPVALVFASCQSRPASKWEADLDDKFGVIGGHLGKVDGKFVAIDESAGDALGDPQKVTPALKFIKKSAAEGREITKDTSDEVLKLQKTVKRLTEDLSEEQEKTQKWKDAYHSRPALIALGGAVLGGLAMIVGLGGALGLASSMPFLAFAAGKVGRRIAAWGGLTLVTCAAIYECWPYRWYIFGGCAAVAIAFAVLDMLWNKHLEGKINAEIDAVEEELVKDSSAGASGILNYTLPETVKYARLRMSKEAFKVWTERNSIKA